MSVGAWLYAAEERVEDYMRRLMWAMMGLGFLAVSTPAFSVSCNTSNNIVQDCSFANGTYTSTINGATSKNVPVDWTPNYGYDLEPSYNQVVTSYVLEIGNYDYQPVPTLSQTLNDTAGASYTASLDVDYGGAGKGDSGAFFEVLVNGTPVISLNDTAPGTFTPYTFSFTGTGSDTITIEGTTNPSSWFVDNVIVTDPVPEASSGLLLLVALLSGGLWLAVRQRFSGVPQRAA
jgi:hypothetical protein